MEEVQHFYKAGYRVVLVVLWLTVLILAIKLWAGWATRSLSLLTDALHVLVDSFSTLLSAFAIASLRHTKGQEIWGHRKRDTLAVLLLVGTLGFLGCTLLGVATYQFQALMHPASLLPAIQVDAPLLWLLAMVESVHICLVLFERYESRVLKIAALRHNANHVLQDIWLTILMLLGLAGVALGYVWLDSLMAIVLLLMLVPSVWRMLNWQVPSMVYQVAIAPEVLAKLVLQVEGIAACQQIRSKGVIGRYVLIQMHISLHPEFVNIGHLITERLENLLRERYGTVQVRIYVKQLSSRS
ncbi:cation diffusion facilitator family transporter [Thermocoleostomius sinensis]|jgi:cation diffusion facilitator family transporter|uniref:Cation diffusion facilitator family transporter n=1 Tax=Thermocoleostomius sinensis A174 TaxID=2016057 RepID=A0A9E9C9J7_9CYAN|nr:cation diffusion facilitator family transporter [Thermocoleostomius sinensis]WAL59672.1 cation diffusion facilitator family transporter [Thermocoleostomius sinensis A174]